MILWLGITKHPSWYKAVISSWLPQVSADFIQHASKKKGPPPKRSLNLPPVRSTACRKERENGKISCLEHLDQVQSPKKGKTLSCLTVHKCCRVPVLLWDYWRMKKGVKFSDFHSGQTPPTHKSQISGTNELPNRKCFLNNPLFAYLVRRYSIKLISRSVWGIQVSLGKDHSPENPRGKVYPGGNWKWP